VGESAVADFPMTIKKFAQRGTARSGTPDPNQTTG
jgi:hypothetical protein